MRTVVREAGRRRRCQIDYSMEKTADGWKAYDVIVGGVSLVTNYRDEFNEQIQAGGVDGLIKTLADEEQGSRRPSDRELRRQRRRRRWQALRATDDGARWSLAGRADLRQRRRRCSRRRGALPLPASGVVDCAGLAARRLGRGGGAAGAQAPRRRRRRRPLASSTLPAPLRALAASTASTTCSAALTLAGAAASRRRRARPPSIARPSPMTPAVEVDRRRPPLRQRAGARRRRPRGRAGRVLRPARARTAPARRR